MPVNMHKCSTHSQDRCERACLSACPGVALCGLSDSTIQLGGRIYKSHRGPDTHTKPIFCYTHHLFQIYDVQLQTRMLTVFPISLSNALVVVLSKGYLAFQQGRNQFMAHPSRSEQRPPWLRFLFSCTAPQDR